MPDGLVVEHWANRDDMGTAAQLGWVPPTPRDLLRMGAWLTVVEFVILVLLVPLYWPLIGIH